jgi:hypothetical protein
MSRTFRPATSLLLVVIWPTFALGNTGQPPEQPPEQPRDLVVLSDLHAGEGRLSQTGQLSFMEDFRSEAEFVSLVDYLCKRQARAKRPLELFIAGDMGEFLNVLRPPDGKKWPSPASRPGGSWRVTRGSSVHSADWCTQVTR